VRFSRNVFQRYLCLHAVYIGCDLFSCLLQTRLESSKHVFSFGKAQSTVVLHHFLGDTESVGSCKVEMHHLILKEELLNKTQFQECRIVPNVKAVLSQFPKQVIFIELCFYWAHATNSLIKLGQSF